MCASSLVRLPSHVTCCTLEVSLTVKCNERLSSCCVHEVEDIWIRIKDLVKIQFLHVLRLKLVFVMSCVCSSSKGYTWRVWQTGRQCKSCWDIGLVCKQACPAKFLLLHCLPVVKILLLHPHLFLKCFLFVMFCFVVLQSWTSILPKFSICLMPKTILFCISLVHEAILLPLLFFVSNHIEKNQSFFFKLTNDCQIDYGLDKECQPSGWENASVNWQLEPTPIWDHLCVDVPIQQLTEQFVPAFSWGIKTKHLFYFTPDRVLQPGRHCGHAHGDKSKWSCDSRSHPGLAMLNVVTLNWWETSSKREGGQWKLQVANSRLSGGTLWVLSSLRKGGLVAVQMMFKRRHWNPQWGSTCDPPSPVTTSPFV